MIINNLTLIWAAQIPSQRHIVRELDALPDLSQSINMFIALMIVWNYYRFCSTEAV